MYLFFVTISMNILADFDDFFIIFDDLMVYPSGSYGFNAHVILDPTQIDNLSCELLNFVMESVLRKAAKHFFLKRVQLLVYADDIDIIGRTKRQWVWL